MYSKAYLEISNICNLNCSFCIGTKRENRSLTQDEFLILARKIRPFTQYLYLHVMGEPLLHPLLPEFLKICENLDFKVIITTNGVFLPKLKNVLLSSKSLHKINISLHAFEANSNINVPNYIKSCAIFAKEASENGLLCNLRLWNLGKGEHEENDNILGILKEFFQDEWTKNRNGFRLQNKLYLEWGEKFDWPDMDAKDYGDDCFCYALRDQFAVLCDGTVVPCCLDHDGNINLGNLFNENLNDILESERARNLYNNFTKRKASEILCKKCGYARRFK